MKTGSNASAGEIPEDTERKRGQRRKSEAVLIWVAMLIFASLGAGVTLFLAIVLLDKSVWALDEMRGEVAVLTLVLSGGGLVVASVAAFVSLLVYLRFDRVWAEGAMERPRGPRRNARGPAEGVE